MTPEFRPNLEQEIIVPDAESRFGDKSKTLEILANTEVSSIVKFGRIDDAFAKYIEDYGHIIPNHANVVELLRLVTENAPQSNSIIPVEIIHGNDDPVFAIFKPIDGESVEFHEKSGIEFFAPNEEIAFHTSEHFNFDLVPPTIIRTMDEGRIGSIQQFLDPFTHGIFGNVFPEFDYGQNLRENNDFQSIALLDYILFNADRNNANFFVGANLEGKQQIDGASVPRYAVTEPLNSLKFYAVDHGISMSQRAMHWRHSQMAKMKLAGVPGPMRDMTVTTRTTDFGENLPTKVDVIHLNKEIEIPNELIAKLTDGLNRIDDLNRQIALTYEKTNNSATKDRYESVVSAIELMNNRVRQLIDRGVFLSPYNTKY